MNGKIYSFLWICALLILPISDVKAQNISERPLVYSTSAEMHTSLQSEDPYHQFVFTYQLLPAPGSTWGYDIFADGKLLYHQPEMPGKAGSAGFATKMDAIKVADEVIRLLEHPTRPAVVNTLDMNRMRVH